MTRSRPFAFERVDPSPVMQKILHHLAGHFLRKGRDAFPRHAVIACHCEYQGRADFHAASHGVKAHGDFFEAPQAATWFREGIQTALGLGKKVRGKRVYGFFPGDDVLNGKK